MTESITAVQSGPLAEEAIVIDVVAHEASIEIWAPVELAAAGTGEDFPRVSISNTADSPITYGVTVGPLRDPTNGYVCEAAGEVVQLCVFGRCKARVDGTENIAIGDALSDNGADGRLKQADFASADNAASNINAAIAALGACIAVALKAATVDDDIIPVFVRGPASGTTA